jgi:hypothetical protein
MHHRRLHLLIDEVEDHAFYQDLVETTVATTTRGGELSFLKYLGLRWGWGWITIHSQATHLVVQYYSFLEPKTQ